MDTESMLERLFNEGHDVVVSGRDLEWMVIVDELPPVVDCTLSCAVQEAFQRAIPRWDR